LKLVSGAILYRPEKFLTKFSVPLLPKPHVYVYKENLYEIFFTSLATHTILTIFTPKPTLPTILTILTILTVLTIHTVLTYLTPIYFS